MTEGLPRRSAASGEAADEVGRAAGLRVVAASVTAGAGFGAGVVVARRLGEEGKGIVGLLGFLASATSLAGALGLAEAAVVLVRREGYEVRTAASSSLATVVASSVPAMAVFLVVAAWQLHDGWSAVDAAVVWGLVLVPIAAANRVLAGIAQARGSVNTTSVALALEAVVALFATALLVLGLDGGSGAAMLGLVLGAAGSAVFLVGALRGVGVSVRAMDRRYVRAAIRYGVPVQIASVLVVLAGRVDLLVVATIMGNRPAGAYSIALTVGQLVVFTTSALAVASAPRLAAAHADDVPGETAHLCRIAVAGAALAAMALAVVAPLAVPFAFGPAFDRAVGPSIALAGAGVLAAAQVTLARAQATVGRPFVLVRSFGASVVAMLLLDVALIPRFGLGGAAAASAAATGVGLAVAVAEARADLGAALRLRDLVPRTADVRIVLSAPRRVLGQRPNRSQA